MCIYSVGCIIYSMGPSKKTKILFEHTMVSYIMTLGASKTHGKFQTNRYTAKPSTLNLKKIHISKTNFPQNQ